MANAEGPEGVVITSPFVCAHVGHTDERGDYPRQQKQTACRSETEGDNYRIDGQAQAVSADGTWAFG